MYSKKRSKSQRIGSDGEVAFRNAVRLAGLIPNKVEEDFGIDFLCMIEVGFEHKDIGEIKGDIVGAAVRATGKNNGRIRFKRREIEYLLSCKIPIIVTSVDAHLRGHEDVRFKLLDEGFATRLIEFLIGTNKTISFRHKEFLEVTALPSLIKKILTPGFVETINMLTVKLKLSKLLPDFQVNVVRGSDGQLTLMRTSDFLTQYDAEHPTVKRDLRIALLGSSDRMAGRLGKIPIRKEILDAANHLPHPLIIHGSLIEREEKLVATGPNGTEYCTFTGRRIDDGFGYVHTSGFSITISDPKPLKDEMVHLIDVQIDPLEQIRFDRNTDLLKFLEKCLVEHSWGWGDSPHLIPVIQSGQLGKYGALCLYMSHVLRKVPWLKNEVYLNDAEDEETLNSLSAIAMLLHDPDTLQGWGFAIDIEGVDLDDKTPEIVQMDIPIYSNLTRCGLITIIRANVETYFHDGYIFGLRLRKIINVRSERVDDRFIKDTDWPEIVISKQWGAIELGESIRQTRSDLSSRPYEAVLIDESETK